MSLGIDLIILAAIAVFVISLLYSVLGQKSGSEQPPPARRYREAPVRVPEADEAADAEARARLRPAFTGPAAAGLEAIAAQDGNFSPDDFTRGARKAYELTVTAFADGDRDSLRQLVDDGRVLLRPSGTEPLVRVMVEADSAERAQEVADRLAAVVRTTIG